MQPRMAGLFGAERQQLVVGAVACTATAAAAGRRPNRIAVEPLGHAAGEGAGLGGRARQPAIELGDAPPFVEQGPPVLARPTITAGAQQRDHARLVTRKQVQDGRTWCGVGKDDASAQRP